MANFSIANIMRLITMILLAVAFAMVLCFDNKGSYNAVYVVLAGGLVVYITLVVGIFTEEVDAELAQYTDIITIGPTLGLGVFWLVSHVNGSHVCGMVMGICSIVASVFMLLGAIFTN